MFPEVASAHPLALAGVDAYALDRRIDHRGSETSAPQVPILSHVDGGALILVVRSHRGVLRGAYAHPCADAQLAIVEGAAMLACTTFARRRPPTGAV